MRGLPLIVREASRPTGWWGVYEVKPGGAERLFAGPFRDRDRAEELAAKVRATR